MWSVSVALSARPGPKYSGEEGAVTGKVPGSVDYKAILIVTLMLCDIWKITPPLWAFVSTSFK